MPRMEFHCHTIYSKDSLTPPQRLAEACRRKGIDRVVITDHNTIAGAKIAQAADPERVIVGEEIMTTRGEILAAFVTTEIPALLTPGETIERLREQGAFISVSHPFDAWRKGGWEEEDLLNHIRCGCHRNLQLTLHAACVQQTRTRFCHATRPGRDGWLGCTYCF